MSATVLIRDGRLQGSAHTLAGRLFAPRERCMLSSASVRLSFKKPCTEEGEPRSSTTLFVAVADGDSEPVVSGSKAGSKAPTDWLPSGVDASSVASDPSEAMLLIPSDLRRSLSVVASPFPCSFIACGRSESGSSTVRVESKAAGQVSTGGGQLVVDIR